MHGFGFGRKPTQNTRWTFLSWLGIIIVLIFSLVILQGINLYQKRYNIKNHLASISQEVGYRIGIIEPQLAQIVTYGSRYIEQLQNNEHMQSSQTAGDLLRYIDEIDALTFQARGGIIGTYIQKIGGYIDLLGGLSTYTDDILSLLGYSAPQTYVVVLQNTAEVRPNGGFFGSFALVTLHYAQITKIEIIDSYHPARENPDLMIQGPERLTKFLPDNNVYFVGANKIGFTYHDGAHIQQLYEQAYPRQPIRGVIFVDTEMISKILPEFQKAQRERQFTNAATDLIRGGGFGKKELYLNKSSDFIIEHQKELLINGISKLPQLIQEHHINLYLDDISVSGGVGGGLTQRLRTKNLTTRYETDHLYVWGSNISYNKIDSFIRKKTTLTDSLGNILMTSTDDNIALGSLDIPAGSQLEVTYRLDIPQVYRQYIWGLEAEYAIELTDRERHILGLTPTRATRGLIYLPAGVQAKQVSGRVREEKIFQTPFAHAVSYETDIQADGGESRVVVELR